VWRALQGHRAAAIGVGGLDIGARKAERREQVERRLGELVLRDAEPLDAEGLAERPFVEREFDVEGRAERRLDRGERRLVEALFDQRLMVDRRRALRVPWPSA
jgi:hypothetical protein